MIWQSAVHLDAVAVRVPAVFEVEPRVVIARFIAGADQLVATAVLVQIPVGSLHLDAASDALPLRNPFEAVQIAKGAPSTLGPKPKIKLHLLFEQRCEMVARWLRANFSKRKLRGGCGLISPLPVL